MKFATWNGFELRHLLELAGARLSAARCLARHHRGDCHRSPLLWEYRYPQYGFVTATELHIPVSDPAQDRNAMWYSSIEAYRAVMKEKPGGSRARRGH